MANYTYHNTSELQGIIDHLKEGHDPDFRIYSAEGRRLRYDFNTNSATLMITDDNVPQVNPYYKAPYSAPEMLKVVEEQVQADESTEDGKVPVGSAGEVLEGTELIDDDEVVLEESDEMKVSTEEGVQLGGFTESDDEDGEVYEDEGGDDYYPDEVVDDEIDYEYEELRNENESLKQVNEELKSDLTEVNEKLIEANKELSIVHGKIEQLDKENSQYRNMSTDDYVNILVSKGYKVELTK